MSAISLSPKYSEMKILIIDDNPVNIRVVMDYLKTLHLNFLTATNGEDGLVLAQQNIPELILLDIMMPTINGFDVCKQLKESEVTRGIPVIFLTALHEVENVVTAFEVGGIDFIYKPFNGAELIARVKNHLDLNFTHKYLEYQNYQLNELVKEKNFILSVAAHDLKNPLYNISMIAKSLRNIKDADPNLINEFLDDLITSTDLMFDIITNLLDLNALESGKIDFKPEEFIVEDVLDFNIKNYKIRAKDKNIKIEFEVYNINETIFTDKRAFQQTFDNLISNALKYSPFNSTVWVRAEIIDKKYCKISIKDNGPGLSLEDQRRLFQKFVKLTPKPTGNESSTGLGLSITKKYVELMKGRISCESELGKGSTFSFIIPIDFNNI